MMGSEGGKANQMKSAGKYHLPTAIVALVCVVAALAMTLWALRTQGRPQPEPSTRNSHEAVDMAACFLSGLDEDIAAYERPPVKDAEVPPDLEEFLRKLREARGRGETLWRSDDWMKEPEYYQGLTTEALAAECFERSSIFASEVVIYNDDARRGLARLKTFHNGFAELLEREDAWRGFLHVYRCQSELLDPQSDLKTTYRAAGTLGQLSSKLFTTPELKALVWGHEEEFFRANLYALARFVEHLEQFNPETAGWPTPRYFGEPLGVVSAGLLLANHLDPETCERIRPIIAQACMTKRQDYDELRLFLRVALVCLEEVQVPESGSAAEAAQP